MRHHRFRNVTVCLGLLAVITASTIMISCSGRQKESSSQVSHNDINAVMEAHSAELMAIPGVVGVAIGETDGGKPCILVLVKEDSDQVRKAVPQQLEGYPTRLMVTGEIKPMQGK